MIEDELRRFIAERERVSGPDDLTDDYPLIESQLLDSLGIFSIVSFVEQQFGVQIEDEELILEHFGTIARIARLVQSKQEHRSRPTANEYTTAE